MKIEFDGQVVVVVGAASGIGRATAIEFARAGAQVCWLDISPTVFTQSKSTDVPQSPNALPVAYQVDATHYHELQEAARMIHRDAGRVDHVVVSLGLASGTLGFPFWNLDPLVWDRVVGVNLMGAVNVAHAFVPYMLPRRAGSFCFVASVAGQIGSQTDPPYSAAKAGLINFMQCAAKDLAPYQIRANAISPGMVQTAINRQVWESWRRASPDNQLTYEAWGEEKVRKIAPLGCWQTAEEMATTMLFLASRQARNITGQTVNVDGGQVMHA